MHDRFRTVSGFIVKNMQVGEYDASITILTTEYGKMRAIGRGAQSLKSRRRTALQPLTKSTLLLERHYEQWYVREAQIEKNLTMIEERQKQIVFFGQILKIVDRLMPYESTEIDHQGLFQNVEEAYNIANAMDDKKSKYMLHLFCAKILVLLGLFPEFGTNSGSDLSQKIKITESVRILLQKIRHHSCTALYPLIQDAEEQKTAMSIIQRIYRRVVMENTSAIAPMRSMSIASSS